MRSSDCDSVLCSGGQFTTEIDIKYIKQKLENIQ